MLDVIFSLLIISSGLTMHMSIHRSKHILFIFILFISIASITKAQDMKDEFKKHLRQSLLNSEMKRSNQMHQPFILEAQKNPDVLRVSPTTRLPTRLDRFISVKEIEIEKVNISINTTNRAPITKRPSDMDFDPVRAIQNHKAKKRKKKVDRIVKAYSME